MRRREHQSGFGTTVVLLAVLVVAVLAVTGLVVYQHHKQSSAKNSATTSQTQATTQPQSTTATQPAVATTPYLNIKEWGVRLTLDSKTQTLYYFINPQLPDDAYLSLKTVSGIAPNCAADKGSLGAIFRLTPTEQQSIVSNPQPLQHAGTLHVGNYYYGFVPPQVGCIGNNPATLQAIAKVQAAYNLEAIFKTLEVVPSTN